MASGASPTLATARFLADSNTIISKHHYWLGVKDSSTNDGWTSSLMSTIHQRTDVDGPESVLVIGSTGELGIEVIQRLALDNHAAQQVMVVVYGMCSDDQHVPQHVMNFQNRYTDTLIQGNATNPSDLRRALWLSNPRVVVVTSPDANGQEGIVSPGPIVEPLGGVLGESPKFQHVHVIVASLVEEDATLIRRAVKDVRLTLVRTSKVATTTTRRKQLVATIKKWFQRRRQCPKDQQPHVISPSVLSNVARTIADLVFQTVSSREGLV